MPKLTANTEPATFLFQGAAGTGKTSFACRFPRPLLINLDKNLNGIRKVLADAPAKLEDVEYINVDVDENNKPVAYAFQFDNFIKVLSTALARPDRDTVIIDSLSVLNELLTAHILRKFPTKTGQMEIPSWGQFLSAYSQLLTQLRQVSKIKVLIAHESSQELEGGKLLTTILCPGKSRETIPALVTDVLRFTVTKKLINSKLTTQHMISTAQTEALPGLKSTFRLPEQFEATQANADAILSSYSN